MGAIDRVRDQVAHKTRRAGLRAQWAIQLRGVNFDPYGHVRIHPSVKFEGEGVTLGHYVSIKRGALVRGPCSIGTSTFINAGAWIMPATEIGPRCSVGPFVRFVTDSHVLRSSTKRAGANTSDPIRIGAGCWIGAGAMILPGVTVGEGAVIGAGSLVTRDVEPNSLVVGSPARLRRYLDDNGE